MKLDIITATDIKKIVQDTFFDDLYYTEETCESVYNRGLVIIKEAVESMMRKRKQTNKELNFNINFSMEEELLRYEVILQYKIFPFHVTKLSLTIKKKVKPPFQIPKPETQLLLTYSPDIPNKNKRSYAVSADPAFLDSSTLVSYGALDHASDAFALLSIQDIADNLTKTFKDFREKTTSAFWVPPEKIDTVKPLSPLEIKGSFIDYTYSSLRPILGKPSSGKSTYTYSKMIAELFSKKRKKSPVDMFGPSTKK